MGLDIFQRDCPAKRKGNGKVQKKEYTKDGEMEATMSTGQRGKWKGDERKKVKESDPRKGVRTCWGNSLPIRIPDEP